MESIGTTKCPIHKCAIFVLGKAAQGFPVRRTLRTSQPKTRGERCPAQKGPFMDGDSLISEPSERLGILAPVLLDTDKKF